MVTPTLLPRSQKKQTRAEKAAQSKFEEQIERLGKLLDKHGFVNAMRMVADTAPDKITSSRMRDEMINTLQHVECHVQHMFDAADLWRRLDEALGERPPEDHTKLGKLDALANDTRGSINERAVAKAMADKIRGSQ